jgi:hypothetical protein
VLADRSVEVVVYVRRQDELVLSWYNQAVKAQGMADPLPPPDDPSHLQWDISKIVAPWESVFSSIRLRVYETGQMLNGDICSDFFSVVGISSKGIVVESEPRNTRLVRDLLEMQRITNCLPLSYQEKRRYHHELMALARAPGITGRLLDTPLWSTAERIHLLSRFESSNQSIARRYFGRDELFSDSVPVTDASACSYPGLRPETTALVMGWLLAKR